MVVFNNICLRFQILADFRLGASPISNAGIFGNHDSFLPLADRDAEILVFSEYYEYLVSHNSVMKIVPMEDS